MAGCAGLVFQMWHEGVWPGFGGGPSVFDDRPHMTTAKALLVNGAYPYDWTAGGSNASLTRDRQGCGTPDVAALYRSRYRTFIVDETDVLPPQGAAVYTLQVPPGTPALKGTLVYADPPASPAAAIARVNDLSLRVVSPSEEVYWGNHGLRQGIWSVPGGEPDTRNTVENVLVRDPEPGVWTVEVRAVEIVMDGHVQTPALDADFALVVSGVVVGAGCYPDCDADGSLTLADFGCFQTRFALADPYADCDGDGALTLADFGCCQTTYALGCP